MSVHFRHQSHHLHNVNNPNNPYHPHTHLHQTSIHPVSRPHTLDNISNLELSLLLLILSLVAITALWMIYTGIKSILHPATPPSQETPVPSLSRRLQQALNPNLNPETFADPISSFKDKLHEYFTGFKQTFSRSRASGGGLGELFGEGGEQVMKGGGEVGWHEGFVYCRRNGWGDGGGDYSEDASSVEREGGVGRRRSGEERKGSGGLEV